MNSKEKVKINVYKQLLKEEKSKSKNMKKAILSVFVLMVFTFTTYNEYSNSKENYSTLSDIYTSETESEDSVLTLITGSEEKETIRGSLYDDFFTNI